MSFLYGEPAFHPGNPSEDTKTLKSHSDSKPRLEHCLQEAAMHCTNALVVKYMPTAIAYLPVQGGDTVL